MIIFGVLLWAIGSGLIAAEVSYVGGDMISACMFNVMAVIGGYIHGHESAPQKAASRERK